MTYGFIFWGNPYHSNTVFKLQKRIVRIMVVIRNRDSCREYFRKLKILPLQSQYIYIYIYIHTHTHTYTYSHLLFVINNKQHLNNIYARNNLELHYPQSHLAVMALLSSIALIHLHIAGSMPWFPAARIPASLTTITNLLLPRQLCPASKEYASRSHNRYGLTSIRHHRSAHIFILWP
jgi:hypothetical protein